MILVVNLVIEPVSERSHLRRLVVDAGEVCAYHTGIMASMTIRTTVAFDPPTVARWERLAKRWGTSKSEALRRALQAAESSAGAELCAKEPQFTGMTPMQIVDWLSANPQVPPGWGQSFRQDLKGQREADAADDDARGTSRKGADSRA